MGDLEKVEQRLEEERRQRAVAALADALVQRGIDRYVAQLEAERHRGRFRFSDAGAVWVTKVPGSSTPMPDADQLGALANEIAAAVPAKFGGAAAGAQDFDAIRAQVRAEDARRAGRSA